MDEKTCTKCGETKPLDEFSRDKSRRDGRSFYCKSCVSAYRRAYRASNLSEVRKRENDYYWSNRELVLSSQKASRDADPDKFRGRKKDAYWRDPERARSQRMSSYYASHAQNKERRRVRWANNRQSLNEKQRAHYAENRDVLLARARDYYASNPHIFWAGRFRRRAAELGLKLIVEDFTKPDVIARYGDSCFYCETGSFEHLDHYVPIKSGGPHTLDNVRPSCAACNLAKSDLDPDEWLAEQAALDDLTEDELEAVIDAEIDRWTQPKESK